MSPLAPGSFVGRYKVLSAIGAGAMGEVVLAEDPQIGRKLALKTVRVVEGRPQDIEDRKLRLLREARAAGRLLHPNIVTLFDVGEDQGALYLAFEFVDGMDLSSRLATPPPLALGEALRIVRQAATALDYAHRQGIVHRDIKPSNLLIARDGEVKVADFGIAKMLDQTSDLTSTGSVVGSPHYLSPEQIRGDELDGRSDIFSLGVVLYEILCRSRPFEGETLTTLVYQILHQEPTSLVVRRPDLGARVEGLVRRMLAKDRDQRFATARELADEVASIERELPAPLLARPAAASPDELQQTRRLEGTAPTSVHSAPTQAPPPPPPPRAGASAAPPPPPPAAGRPSVTPPTEPLAAAQVGAAPSAGSSGRLWIVAGIAVVALAAIVGGGFAARHWLASRAAKVPPAEPSDVRPAPSAAVAPPTPSTTVPATTLPANPPPANPAPATVAPPPSSTPVTTTPASEPAAPPAVQPTAEPGTRYHQTTPATTEPQPSARPPVATVPESRPPAPEPERPPADEPATANDEPEEAAATFPDVKIDREMTTGMSLSFEVQPDDLIVKIDKTVIGQANQWNARKGDKRSYELPTPGPHLVRILRDGQLLYAIRIDASPGGPSITPIVVNLKPGKPGRTRGRG